MRDVTHALMWCDALQRAATRCNALQRTATHCNTLHICGATMRVEPCETQLTNTCCTTHCNTQHSAPNCTALKHTSHVCRDYTYRATRDATHAYMLHCNALHRTATHCNALQHTATHCNTLYTCGETMHVEPCETQLTHTCGVTHTY